MRVTAFCLCKQNLNYTNLNLSCDRPILAGRFGPATEAVYRKTRRNKMETRTVCVMRVLRRVPCRVGLGAAQGRAVGQFGQSQGEELNQAGDILDRVLAPMVGHIPAKSAQWQIVHELKETELALVYGCFARKSAKNPKSDFRRSNRNQIETTNSTSKS